jgi:hypothetical protein
MLRRLRQAARSSGCFLVFLLVPVVAAAEPTDASAGRTAAVMERVWQISETLQHSQYSHVTQVNEGEGSYVFDCSGFVAWVLRRAASGAHHSVVSRSKNRRPLARDYYWEIARTRPRSGRGWARVERVLDARPGDVVAWLKPPQVRSANTGHVAFVVEAPVPSQLVDGGYLLRVADASRYYHDDDEREALGRSGFGMGTILIVADPVSQAPVAYGWFGDRSSWILPAQIAIGRPTR